MNIRIRALMLVAVVITSWILAACGSPAPVAAPPTASPAIAPPSSEGSETPVQPATLPTLEAAAKADAPAARVVDAAKLNPQVRPGAQAAQGQAQGQGNPGGQSGQGQGQSNPGGQPGQLQASAKGSGAGYQGAFQGLGELTIDQAAVKYNVDAQALKSQLAIPSADPYESITSLQTQGLDKAALQTALNQLGRIQNPNQKALAEKRQQDFESLMNLAHVQYKTALVSTNQKNAEAAAKSVNDLARYWKNLSDLYSVTAPPTFAADKAWSSDLAKVVQAINAAQAAIGQGDLAAGHEALEPVREILLDIRTRNNAQIFPDQLTIFHRAMETVTTPTTGKTAETLSANDLAAMKSGYARMIETFRLIEQAPATLNAEQAQAYQSLVQAERAAMSALDQALQAGDKATTLKAAGDIKAIFTKLFVNFG